MKENPDKLWSFNSGIIANLLFLVRLKKDLIDEHKSALPNIVNINATSATIRVKLNDLVEKDIENEYWENVKMQEVISFYLYM